MTKPRIVVYTEGALQRKVSTTKPRVVVNTEGALQRKVSTTKPRIVVNTQGAIHRKVSTTILAVRAIVLVSLHAIVLSFCDSWTVACILDCCLCLGFLLASLTLTCIWDS